MIDGLIRTIGTLTRTALVATRLIDRPAFVGRYVDERPAPDELRYGEIVVVGTPRFQKWACFPCPDGCGDMVALNLSKSRRPAWGIKLDWFSRVTVQPSIHEKSGCRSHYWIQSGKLIWCKDSGHQKTPSLKATIQSASVAKE